MDAKTNAYARRVAAEMASVFGAQLVGVYLHGSAVLGGFDPRRSDVDIVVVCENVMTAVQQSAVAERLRAQHLPCPAAGLELSIVTLAAAGRPSVQPLFELHITTAPTDSKVIDGHGHPGDPDLILHFAVCRQAGRLVGPGRAAAEVFAPIGRDMVAAQLMAEVRWGAGHAPAEYAVLNACRAWQFAMDGVLVSKVDGGQWALERMAGVDRELIRAALDRQRCLTGADLDSLAVAHFVRRVLGQIADPIRTE
ncbi:DUF4111 domain-containing protein [Mycobacteroides immunogenum]|uniref:aminoglycoside adenylyltransferase domain-containing protein n=1 Tax=Mycobacteroides immunogenum TaxID=83262 RepID=UPI0025B78C6A|nr:aminoglycoside adenylyltransferase domain-containing protein [Mycobacteroides immunogenum]WJR35246.1 DUF4111 domain-containing protein [Mycobacteroides immunogenum]